MTRKPVVKGVSVRGIRTTSAVSPQAATNHDTVYGRLLDTVSLADLPPPPANGPAWRERANAIEGLVPGLADHLAAAPIGWFPLLERAAQEIAGLLAPGETFMVRQVKEKLSGLRWYAHVVTPSNDLVGRHLVVGAVSWAEHVSETVCCLYGTADGSRDTYEGWHLTLSPRARQDRRSQDPRSRFSERLYPAWTRD